MKWIWYDLSEIEINSYDNYIIMMLPTIFFECDVSVIKKYSKLKNVKMILILLDTIGVNTPVGRLINDIYKDTMWDYIFSYDYEDCKKYGFNYLDECYYSKHEINLKYNSSEKYDAYFIGALKPGRTHETIELFEYLTNNNVKTKFDIVKNDKRTISYNDKNFNILNKRKPYQYILDSIQNTNCIIEFLQKEQNTQSLRYFEAVCFNKKLLTNNKNAKRLSFYNEKYIKIFDKLEDIDIEWLQRKETVDYGYKNEFSPIHLLEKIERLERKNKEN